jgi:CO/xanthine dehydrogenase Mo-binding subunit
MMSAGKLTRRQFFQGTGALIVGFSATGSVEAFSGAAQGTVIPDYPAIDLTAVDSFIEVHSDGKVLVNIGKTNNGQGTPTSWAMMVAEELDVSVGSLELKYGDTAATPDQGGSGNSNGVQAEYEPLRQAAATARQALLKLASTNLGVPASNLNVQDGVVSAMGNSKSVTYAQLIGNRKFNVSFSATAPVKDPSQFKIIGKLNPQRPEIAKIAVGTLDYVQDVRLPDMLHARSIRPSVAGSTLVKVDGFAGGNPPGLVKVLSKGNYVAVVAKTEWQAIQASVALKVTWKEPATPVFPNGYEALYDYLMKTAPQDTATRPTGGNVDEAIASAAQTITATYYSSFQSHAALTPGCCVADVKDGGATVWFGGQKPPRVRRAVADLLGLPSAKVRVIFYQGPGSYGTSDADDAAAEAAWISQQIGKPIRLQWMRDEGIAWDPKGPPLLAMMRAGIDSNGKVIAWDYDARLLNGNQRNAGALIAGNTLIGQAMGYEPPNMTEHGLPGAAYNFANKRATSKVVPSKWAYQTGLRTAHFRDPNGPQTTLPSEQFIEEIEATLKMDPIAFRLAYLDPVTAVRDINVIQEVKKASGWIARPSPNNANSAEAVVSGRGFAYGPRQASIVGTVAEVTVNRKTGQVQITKFTSGLDAGLIVHQKNAVHAIEGNLMQSMSRALYEGVAFDSENVKAVDWITYPTIDIKEIPEVNAFLINPDGKSPAGKFIPPSGVGEPSTKPTAAAIANAIFDATGVRMRRQPLTAQTVLAALKAAGKAL